MANTVIQRKGFGQVEPNHLSAQTNGQIYAQLPASTAVGTILENGRFLKYDYASHACNTTGEGEWMLVMNEIKLYDERKQGLKDYAMKATDFMGETMVPRLLRTQPGDIYTTNCFVGPNTSQDAVFATATTFTVGDYAVPGTNGYLAKATTAVTSTSDMVWQVVQEYTMPDDTPGVKLQRIK